jgi:Methyltransferase small domain
MPGEVKYLNLAGQMLIFSNPESLYPVNQYQSLILATASEFVSLLVAGRRGCHVQELSAWEPCCGGGPAAVTLKRLGLRYVQATDISEDAINACRANASRNFVTLDNVMPANMLNDGRTRRFDLIACNPPCFIGNRIDIDQQDAMQQAIVGGWDGMELTHQLLSQSPSRLSDSGSLVFVVVSTGYVRRLTNWLNEMFPERWRTFPSTPVAAPYAPVGDPRIQMLKDPSLDFKPMIWERSDGWYWRMTWVVEATTSHSFFPASADVRRTRSGFTMCPFGHDVSRDPGLEAMIKEVSEDGFWLS